jgi:hypothetical protein
MGKNNQKKKIYTEEEVLVMLRYIESKLVHVVRDITRLNKKWE